MIDEELIEKKLDIIIENLKYLGKIRKIDKNKFLNSFEKLQATKHSLQEAIEASLDISNHIISSNDWKRAESYSEMFERLYEHNILDKELKDNLSNMAKFRNILLHRYGKIDDERLWKILNQNIKDIHKYIREIEKFMDKE